MSQRLDIPHAPTPLAERRRGSRGLARADSPASPDPRRRPRVDAASGYPAGGRADAPAAQASTNPLLVLWGLGILLAAYVVTALLRSSGQVYPWLDRYGVAGFGFAAAAVCLWRAHTHALNRGAVTFLGLALVSWSTGELLASILALSGAETATPSIADVFFLLFYPLTYVALTLLVQARIGRLGRPNWLDGVVAGLGAAALCATFAFRNLVQMTSGSHLQSVVNLAYPVGDLLLLLLVIGGTVLLGAQASAGWYVAAVGLIAIVGGDTANLLVSPRAQGPLGGSLAMVAWPAAIYLLSLSMWTSPRPTDPLRISRAPGFLAPGLAAVAALVILISGNLGRVTDVAVALAVVTLVAVGVRVGLSAQELRRLTEERHRQANTDELTGLANRRHLSHILDAFFAEEADNEGSPRRLAFLFVDLNHFKEINDSLGHPAGDELLRQLGPRLRQTVGAGGTVVRLGGDELAILLLDAGPEAAADVAERVTESLAAPFALRSVETSVSASIGIALYPDDALDGAVLMWSADVAMYRAKLSGDAYVFYDPSLDGLNNHIHLLDDLSDAVRNGELVLHFQPQMDLSSGAVSGVEALVRWPHPHLGLVPPVKFLPLAEEAGLMAPLTAWVMEAALRQCARWRRDGRDLTVSVNVSASNLLDEGLVELVERLLERYGLPSHCLVVEVTESVIIREFDRAGTVIRRLRDLGVLVSIDDFGAGVTSLAYLSGLPVSELKLDRAFLAGVTDTEGPRTLELVRATINLGHEMGLRVVAEGIEDAATLARLVELGCDLAQGDYISRPVPADELPPVGAAPVPLA